MHAYFLFTNYLSNINTLCASTLWFKATKLIVFILLTEAGPTGVHLSYFLLVITLLCAFHMKSQNFALVVGLKLHNLNKWDFYVLA
jgi:hypothetical protein